LRVPNRGTRLPHRARSHIWLTKRKAVERSAFSRLELWPYACTLQRAGRFKNLEGATAMLNIQSANPEEWNGEEATWTTTRRAPRVQLPTEVPGEVNGSLAARLVDLSAHGVRLEHADILRPGHRCLLSAPLGSAARTLHLPSRVVWSQVRHIERQ